MLDTDYIKQLPKNSILAAGQICEDVKTGSLIDDPIDIISTLEVILGDDTPKSTIIKSKSSLVRFLSFPISVLSDSEQRISEIHRHVKALIAREIIVGSTIARDASLISFEGVEIKKIEKLLHEIKDIVREADSFDEDHKLRLLKIVNNMLREIDKPLSSYRVFLDGMIETSEALGTAGEKAKPVFDRMREIFGIADKVKKMVEQLEGPEELKRLPSPDADNSD